MPWDEPTSTDDDEPAVASKPLPGAAEPAALPPLLPSMRDVPLDPSAPTSVLEPLPLPLPAQPAELFGTVAVSDLAPTSVGAPFPLAGSTGEAPTLQPAAFPGAPWSDAQATPVTAPSGDPLASTLGVSDVLSPAAAPESREPEGLGANFLAALEAVETRDEAPARSPER